MNNHTNTESKYSKLAIIFFILTVISIPLLIVNGFTYSDMSNLVYGQIMNLISIAILIFISYWVKKHHLKGLLLNRITIGLTATMMLIALIFSILLMKEQSKVKEFALTNSSKMFAEDISFLKDRAYGTLKLALYNEDDAKVISMKAAEVGPLKECKFEIDDSVDMYYGLSLEFDRATLGHLSRYSITCFSDKRLVKLYVGLKKSGDDYLITSYNFDSNYVKNLDLETFKEK